MRNLSVVGGNSLRMANLGFQITQSDLCPMIPSPIVFGVVYAPVTPDGILDLIAWAEGMDHLLRNGSVVTVDLSERVLSDGDTVIVSAAAIDKPLVEAYV